MNPFLVSFSRASRWLLLPTCIALASLPACESNKFKSCERTRTCPPPGGEAGVSDTSGAAGQAGPEGQGGDGGLGGAEDGGSNGGGGEGEPRGGTNAAGTTEEGGGGDRAGATGAPAGGCGTEICELPCQSDDDCGPPFPFCSNQDLCVECESNENCSEPRPRCDAAGRCVQCLGPTDCEIEAPECSEGECLCPLSEAELARDPDNCGECGNDCSTLSPNAECTEGVCTPPSCGNGDDDEEEECDDGNDIDEDDCNNACAAPRCGDEIVQLEEECDDGNDIDEDDCNNECRAPNCVPTCFCKDRFCAQIESITVGYTHSCALSAGGDVWCWGDNFLGQVGAPGFGTIAQPTLMSSISDVVDVDVGTGMTCASDSRFAVMQPSPKRGARGLLRA